MSNNSSHELKHVEASNTRKCERKEKEMSGCDLVDDGVDITGKFEKVLFQTGENICDYCPYKDCIASQSQCIKLQNIQRDYHEQNMPDCDKRVFERRELMKKILYDEQRNARRNPTGKRRGRPRKGVAIA